MPLRGPGDIGVLPWEPCYCWPTEFWLLPHLEKGQINRKGTTEGRPGWEATLAEEGSLPATTVVMGRD